MKRPAFQWWQLIAPVLVVVTVMGIGTYLEGNWTGRWRDLTDTETLKQMAAHMDNIPLKFGEWEGAVIPPDDGLKQQHKKAQVTKYQDIVYRHRRLSGKEVRMSLVCAPHRSIARHTPDKCYVGAGFDIADEERLEDVTTSDGVMSVRTAQFIRQSETSRQNQRIVWTFSDDGKWIAPESGRIALAGSDAWFKLYVTVALPGNKRSTDIEDCREFLRDFLPVLNRALFPDKPEAAAATEEVAKA
jgi:hypothetical protein